MPKVSVIVPVYNASCYLSQCIESVQHQILHDIEILCIDDGSFDGSSDILRSFAKADGRIKVIHQRNTGAAVARNEAMKIAVGDFIAFMDADDWYPDIECLSALYEGAVTHDVPICVGSQCEVDEKGRPCEIKHQRLYGAVFTKDELMDYREYQYQYGYTRCVFSRKLLQENGIEFPQRSRFQDPPFFVKAMAAAKRFYAIEKIVYCYRSGKVVWTDEKEKDFVRGNIDIMKIAKDCGLQRLYANTLRYWPSARLQKMRELILSGDEEAIDIMQELYASVDFSFYQTEETVTSPGLITLWGFCMQQELIQLEEKVRFLGGKAKEDQRTLLKIKQSKAYRIGNMLAKTPRKCREYYRKLKLLVSK